jgi:hypothetical protein
MNFEVNQYIASFSNDYTIVNFYKITAIPNPDIVLLSNLNDTDIGSFSFPISDLILLCSSDDHLVQLVKTEKELLALRLKY